MKGTVTHRCQWPECRLTATSLARRGERMENIMLCDRHTNLFRTLTDDMARLISHSRQPMTTTISYIQGMFTGQKERR